MSTRPRLRSGFLLVFENEGVSEADGTLPGDIGIPTDSLSSVGQKTGPGGSSPLTLANGCEAHADERASATPTTKTCR
jgi:hypothetical protein